MKWKLIIVVAIYPLLVFRKNERVFVGVERGISAAASPTKQVEQSPIFEHEYASYCYRIASILYCNYFRMEEIIETG